MLIDNERSVWPPKVMRFSRRHNLDFRAVRLRRTPSSFKASARSG